MWWCLRDVCRFATCLCAVWFTQSGEQNKWHGRMNSRGKKKSRRERSREQFHTLLLGQYKTSLQECHRKFVHFLLHLAAILLDKHHSHLLVLSISLKKPSQTGTHHFQPSRPLQRENPSRSPTCTFACLCQRLGVHVNATETGHFPPAGLWHPLLTP